eukprot:Skav228461  [mRNA]  locus=scaffold1058:320288:329157:- [translate_table: standard]
MCTTMFVEYAHEFLGEGQAAPIDFVERAVRSHPPQFLEELRSNFVELDPTDGLHARRGAFTAPQKGPNRLTETQWQQLQGVLEWAEPTPEKVAAAIWLLAIRPIGKYRSVTSQVPPAQQRPDQADPTALYWTYIHNRAVELGRKPESTADLAVVRLACALVNLWLPWDLQQLQESWHHLSSQEQRSLLRHFLADGVVNQAIIFEHLEGTGRNWEELERTGLRDSGFDFLPKLRWAEVPTTVLGTGKEQCLCDHSIALAGRTGH